MVTEANNGALSSYRINNNGSLETVSQTIGNGQIAPCWIATTRLYAYTANTLSDNISGYRIARDGSLSLLQESGVAAEVAVGSGPSDVAVSRNGRYLDVVASGLGVVSSFRINPLTGNLQHVGDIHLFDALSGMEGLASAE